jgi:hypothetical protein
MRSAVFLAIASAAHAGVCASEPEIRVELAKAASLSAAIHEPFAALAKAEPFKILTQRFPDDLFVHEAYQDTIHENGIEGHLRLLAREYEDLEFQHSGDIRFRHLRALVGRTTFTATQGLSEIVAQYGNFAAAHRTLAEIYATEAFRDPAKAKLEKETYLALCPGGVLTVRPPPIPPPSSLVAKAGQLLANNGDPHAILEMTYQGLRELEWRSQRIRAFDWYSREFKVRDAQELKAQYMKAWPIQIRCHWRAGRPEAAEILLARMEQRAEALKKQGSPEYRKAFEALAQIYAEAGRTEKAAHARSEFAAR